MRTGREASFRSRDGEASLTISVPEFPPDLSESEFAQEHKARVIAENFPSAPYFEIIKGEGFHKDNAWRYRLAWRLRQDANSCVMDIVDIVLRSRDFPTRPYGYVIRVTICDEHLDAYFKVRESILDSFQEYKPPKR